MNKRRLLAVALGAVAVLSAPGESAPAPARAGAQSVVSVLAFRVAGDAISATDGVIRMSAPRLLTSASGLFTPSARGKTISIQGAGPGGAQLVTTIACYLSPSQVLLEKAASVTISGAGIVWGADNFSAFRSALIAAAGKRLLIPYGNYLINTRGGSDTLAVPSNTVVDMDRRGKLYFVGALSLSHQESFLFVIPAASRNIDFFGIHCVGEWLSRTATPSMNNSACIRANGNLSENVRIQGGIFSNMLGHGIATPGRNEHFDISRNVFRDNANTGVNFNGGEANISDNYFFDDGGMEAGGARSHYAHNTFIHSTGQYALSVGGNTSGTPYKGTEVIGNVIYQPAGNCLGVGDGFGYGTIAENQCLDISGAHIGIANVYSGYTRTDGNSFTNNIVEGRSSSVAFYFSGVTGPRLRGNFDEGYFSTGLAANYTTGIDSTGNVWQGQSSDIVLDRSSTGRTQDTLVHGTHMARRGASFLSGSLF